MNGLNFEQWRSSDTNNNSVLSLLSSSGGLGQKKKSHLLLFVEAQRIKQSQQWWRGTDLFKYWHSPSFASSLSCCGRASLFFLQPQSLSSLPLGKWRPRRQTGALHLVNLGGVWCKTNGSASITPLPAPPGSSHMALQWLLCHGICSPSPPQQQLITHHRSIGDTEAEVDKFINDNNEDDEDDDNINN